VNAQDNDDRWTPLHVALNHGRSAVAQVLLKHGADVKARNKINETPLHFAGNEEVARLLLEHGADANALDIKNRTPLHGVSDMWELLGSFSSMAQIRMPEMPTTRHLASDPKYEFRVEGCLDVARLLLLYGSDIHARDAEGRTPFMRATAEENHEIMQLL
jgi:ankyrin repeat protein